MIGIGSDSIPHVWDRVSDRIAAALKHGNGEYTLGDIFLALHEGKMQLWMTDRSLAITTLIQYPRRTTCLVVVVAGLLDDMKKHLPMLETWALAMGCDGMEIMGRKGWKKALTDYTEAQIHLRKDLACTPSQAVH